MSKTKNPITEFRSYYLPNEFPVLLLTGDEWRISDLPSDNLHFHNCLEIGLCHEGSGTLRIRQKDFPFTAGDVTILARNIPHTTFSASGTQSLWSYIFVDLNELFDSFAPGWAPAISQIIGNLNTAGILHGSECPQVYALLTTLITELKEKKDRYQLNARSLFLSLVISIDRYLQTNNGMISQEAGQENHVALAILPALEYIKTNYMNQFYVETLADLCGLSPTHFRRVFYTTMGTSPLEYLNSVRINKACHLLRSSDESILNISEMVGFHSVSSFNRYFVRLLNMSPREYRHYTSDEELAGTKIQQFSGWMTPE